MKLSELAKLTGHTHGHIAYLARRGDIPGARQTSGGHWRLWSCAELEPWILANRKGPRSVDRLGHRIGSVLGNLDIVDRQLAHNLIVNGKTELALVRAALEKLRYLEKRVAQSINDVGTRARTATAQRETLAVRGVAAIRKSPSPWSPSR